MSTATPPIRRTRAARIAAIEPTPDINPPTIVTTDESTEADVIEQVGGKTISYKAKVSTVNETTENTDQDEITDIENDFTAYEEPPIEIPKTPLAKMFDDIRECGEQGETFIADIMRRQDFMNDGFNSPCQADTSLPPLQLTARDMFTFVPTIQKHNNNSGGRFTIRICRQDGSPLEKWFQPRSIHGAPYAVAIGINTLIIPNPTKEAIQADHANDSEPRGLALILQNMQREQREFNTQLIQTLSARPTKSVLETALEQKMVNEIVNGGSQSKGFDVNEFTQTIMTQGAVMAGLGEAFNKMIFREPPPAPEPDFVDKANKILQIPAVGSAIDRIMEVGEAIAVAKAANAGTPITDQQQHPQQTQSVTAEVIEDNTEDMKELLLTVVDELESENPLNDSNAVIQELKADYPDQFSELAITCKGMPFDTILALLLGRLTKMPEFSTAEYIDIDETNKQGAYIWTPDKGAKMRSRLQELYNYLVALP